MTNILIIDDQEWTKDLCREGLAGESYRIKVTKVKGLSEKG